MSGQGLELLAFSFAILRGEPIPVPGRQPQRPNLAHRMAAATLPYPALVRLTTLQR